MLIERREIPKELVHLVDKLLDVHLGQVLEPDVFNTVCEDCIAPQRDRLLHKICLREAGICNNFPSRQCVPQQHESVHLSWAGPPGGASTDSR